MRRANIVLDDIHYEYLKHRSVQLGKSMSAVLRDLIEHDSLKEAKNSRRDPIHSIVAIARSRKGRSPGQRHDELLYRKQP